MSMTSARQLLLFIVTITIGTALPAAAQQTLCMFGVNIPPD